MYEKRVGIISIIIRKKTMYVSSLVTIIAASAAVLLPRAMDMIYEE